METVIVFIIAIAVVCSALAFYLVKKIQSDAGQIRDSGVEYQKEYVAEIKDTKVTFSGFTALMFGFWFGIGLFLASVVISCVLYLFFYSIFSSLVSSLS